MNQEKKLKILFVSSEVAPFAKTGGLADVAGSLPRAIAEKGHDVRIVMPRYKYIDCPMETRFDFPVMMKGRKETAIIRESYLETSYGKGMARVPVYFIDNYQYFDRDSLYCFFDEAERFAFFCRAVLEMLPGLEFKPDVIHCNDWQTGPIPALLKEQYGIIPFYQDIATVLTIHNLHYQGNYPKDCLELLGFSDEYYHPDRLEFYGDVSFLKAGLVYADIINAVSKTYAREIKTPEYGERLDGLLRKRSLDLYGIVNGINCEEYDPWTDPVIAANYNFESIDRKKENKRFLQKTLGLPAADVPVFGLISRLVDQKGLDLLEDIFDDLMQMDVQLAVLGTGDIRYEKLFRAMSRQYPAKVAAHIGFDTVLAQQIYAGCDLFLMPSRFEPCGLGQLIALRYGTVPVARKTGGLADTVVDYDPGKQKGNGFVFVEYRPEGLLDAIRRALIMYSRPDLWHAMVRSAMQMDFSWPVSAGEYVKLYQTAICRKTEKNCRTA